MKKDLIRVDENGTKYYHCEDRCDKCGGTGLIKCFMHVDGGTCFDCGGTGIYIWDEKEYTPEYEQKLSEQAQKLYEKKLAKAQKEAAKTNAEFFKKNGFTKDGKTYFIIGKTYDIKDELKANGAKWDGRSSHWRMAEVPENIKANYTIIEISVDEMYDTGFGGAYSWTNWKSMPDIDEDGNPVEDHYIYKLERAEQALKDKKYQDNNENSEYVGTIGEKITKKVTYVFRAEWTNHYMGQAIHNYIHTFKDEDGNVYVWKTTSFIYQDYGTTLNLIGTVKEHSEYKGVKQTSLTRCKVTVSA